MKEVICACGVCLYSCLNWQNVFVSNCKNAFVSNWKHVFVSICKKCISFKLQTCICLKLKKNMSLYQFAKNVVVSNWRKMYICLKLNRLLRGRGDGITFVRRSLYFSQVAKMYLSQFEKNVLSNRKIYLYQIENMVMNSGSQLFEMSKILHKARRCKQRRAVPELHPSSSSCLCHGHWSSNVSGHLWERSERVDEFRIWNIGALTHVILNSTCQQENRRNLLNMESVKK